MTASPISRMGTSVEDAAEESSRTPRRGPAPRRSSTASYKSPLVLYVGDGIQDGVTRSALSSSALRGGKYSSLRAAEAHERVINLFLTRVLTAEALKQAIDSLVRKGSEVEVLAAQKAPHVA